MGAADGEACESAGAAFLLALLLGGQGLPLLGLVTDGERAPFCCRGGRCCCAGDTADPGDCPCLRRPHAPPVPPPRRSLLA